METIAVVLMLGAGVGVAVFALAATALARAGEQRGGRPSPRPGRDGLAASLLFHVLSAGNCPREDALRLVRRETGTGDVTVGIDVSSWAESFAQVTTDGQRTQLLETAVRLVAAPGRVVSLRQYAALLDLNFGLGFRADALARLRQLHPFEYVDHAKDGRPRSADRGPATVFAHGRRPVDELSAILGVAKDAPMQEVAAAYRKLAARHHPDRFHGASAEEVSSAAARFIEITRAYEDLVALRREG